MYFTTTLSISALALAASVLALPASKTPVAIEISGMKQFTALNASDTWYLAYLPNFFDTLALQPTSDKSQALTFNLLPNGTLESTTGMEIGVTAFENGPGQTEGAITFANYTGTQGTSVTKPHHEVVNSDPNFYSWLVSSSQYGLGIGYVSNEYNVTYYNSGYSFPAYEVKFHARH